MALKLPPIPKHKKDREKWDIRVKEILMSGSDGTIPWDQLDTETGDIGVKDSTFRFNSDNSGGVTNIYFGSLDTFYFKFNGVQFQFSDDLTAPNYISTIAIGTSPYACTSTTVNTNLNADLLDGNHASDFAVSAHNHDLVYAPIAKGVTNGDTHDHSGGDGAQIDHITLSNIGTNAHSTIDTHIGGTGSAVHGLGTISVENIGADGSFTTVDLKTVTVVNGIITAIV